MVKTGDNFAASGTRFRRYFEERTALYDRGEVLTLSALRRAVAIVSREPEYDADPWTTLTWPVAPGLTLRRTIHASLQ